MLSRDDLHDYQNRAIEFIKSKKRCGLFLGLGMGKTTASLTAMSDALDSMTAAKVLVIAPLRVANSVWAQETKQWTHLSHLRVSVCTGNERTRMAALQRDTDIYTINRENVPWLVKLYGKKWPFDAVIVDECFVGSTPVLTPHGARVIKDVRTGDMVMTSEGIRPVTRVFKKKETHLVRITLSDGSKIECTPEHPIATEAGWVQAVDTKGLRVVRGKLPNESKDECVLQQGMLKNRYVGGEVRRRKENNFCKIFKSTHGTAGMEHGEAVVKCCEKETERCTQRIGPPSKTSGRQRHYLPLRKTNDGDVVLGLDSAICNSHWYEKRFGLSDELQGGFCIPREEIDYRGGWELAQIASASGRKKRYFSEISRVEDVEVFKCEGGREVYNLETEGVHDYFAGGILVHNCSSFKSPSSQRFKALKRALPFTDYVVLLTGTPSPNGLLDLWSQMYLVDFGERLGKTMTGYKQRFFESDYMGYKFTPRQGSSEAIHRLLSDKVLSMSAEDYLQVPDRIDLVERVELPPKVFAQYLEFERTLLAELDDGQEIEAISAAVLANKLLQWSNGATYTDSLGNWSELHSVKLDALADLVEQNPSENMLVAYNYKTDLERLRVRFPDAVVMDKQQETIDRWNRGEIQMMLAHPASAGHGLNLQKGGSMLVWFGLNWSLELYQQFNGRLHRQGQTRPVRVVHMVASGCMDERVIDALNKKGETQNALLFALKPKQKCLQ